jgi:hypothetical protein
VVGVLKPFSGSLPHNVQTVLSRLAVLIAAALATYPAESRTREQDARKSPWAEFGVAVAASSGYLFVAASSGKSGTRGPGTIHLFQRRDSAWVHAGLLSAPEAIVEDTFGVPMAADGSTLVVGAHMADLRGKDSGLAYVFERRGRTWQQAAVLSAADAAADDQFGLTVSVSGETIAVGARLADDRERDAGATYLFQRRGGRWQQSAKLTASDAVRGDLFGRVSVDQDMMVVSADLNDDRGNAAGKAYAFEKKGGVWTELASFTASDAAAGDEFGFSLFLRGGIAVFGAIGVERSAGAAYVFERRASEWVQAARLTSNDEPSRLFGAAVGALADLVVVGAPGDRKGTGAAYVFERRAGAWTQTARLIASDDAPLRRFGNSVAASSNTIVVGALTNGDGTHAGAAYVYERSPGGWSEVAKLVRP